MKEIKHIIWDADNTIWNWTKFAAEAYPEMAQEIATQTGKSLEETMAAMKKVYTRDGTIESIFLVQGLKEDGFLDDQWKEEKVQQLIKALMGIFARQKQKKLRVYPGIQQVFKWTHNQGIHNVILTDAPKVQANDRIRRSKFGEWIHRAYALKIPDDQSKLPPSVQEKIKKGNYQGPLDIQEVEIEKPDTRLEDIIIEIAEVSDDIRDYISRHVAIIGDNPAKDMMLALKYDCLGIYADWGKTNHWDRQALSPMAPDRVLAKNTAVESTNEILQHPNIVTVKKSSIKRGIIQALGLLH